VIALNESFVRAKKIERERQEVVKKSAFFGETFVVYVFFVDTFQLFAGGRCEFRGFLRKRRGKVLQLAKEDEV
jgi:hypothetical protein